MRPNRSQKVCCTVEKKWSMAAIMRLMQNAGVVNVAAICLTILTIPSALLLPGWWGKLFLFALIPASLSAFLWFTQQRGEIFFGYSQWLALHFYHAGRLKRVGERFIRIDMPLSRQQKLRQWLYKPLGGCVYCYGVWVAIITWNLMALTEASYDAAWLYTPFIVALSHLWLFIIMSLYHES